MVSSYVPFIKKAVMKNIESISAHIAKIAKLQKVDVVLFTSYEMFKKVYTNRKMMRH